MESFDLDGRLTRHLCVVAARRVRVEVLALLREQDLGRLELLLAHHTKRHRILFRYVSKLWSAHVILILHHTITLDCHRGSAMQGIILGEVILSIFVTITTIYCNLVIILLTILVLKHMIE